MKRAYAQNEGNAKETESKVINTNQHHKRRKHGNQKNSICMRSASHKLELKSGKKIYESMRLQLRFLAFSASEYGRLAWVHLMGVLFLVHMNWFPQWLREKRKFVLYEHTYLIGKRYIFYYNLHTFICTRSVWALARISHQQYSTVKKNGMVATKKQKKGQAVASGKWQVAGRTRKIGLELFFLQGLDGKINK